LDVEIRVGEVAVDLAVPGEEMPKPNPFWRQDFVPAFDEA
jgi:hypothetical protein